MLSEQKTKKLAEIQNKISVINENIGKAKEQKRNVLLEIEQTVSTEEKEAILKQAEADFSPHKTAFEKAKQQYDNTLTKYNDVLELLNYRIKTSNGKTKNTISVSGNMATVIRDNKKISVSVSGNWQKQATAEIEKAFSCTNGTSRNIVYKISQMLK